MNVVASGFYPTLYDDRGKLCKAVIYIDNSTAINKFGGVKYRRLLYVSPEGTYVLDSRFKNKKK